MKTSVYRYAQRELSEVVSIDYFPQYNRPGMSSGSELALQIQAKGGPHQVLFLCSGNFVFIARLPEPGFPGAGLSLQDPSSHTTLIMCLFPFLTDAQFLHPSTPPSVIGHAQPSSFWLLPCASYPGRCLALGQLFHSLFPCL